LLRLIFRRLPKWIMVLLWGIVALRLLLPVSLESNLSLIPNTETIWVTEDGSDTVVQTGIDPLDRVVAPKSWQVIHAEKAVDMQEFVGTVNDAGHSEERVVEQNSSRQVFSVIGVIWAVGILALLLYAVISYLRVRKSVKESMPFDYAEDRNTGRIRICDRISTPFILGIFRPVIYLPSGLSEEDTAHVIAHEMAHLKRGDHFWKPLGFLLLMVYWFNPLVWAAYILLCRDIEMACDEKVIASMEEADKKAYANALVTCATKQREITVCPLAFGKVGVKERVKGILNYKRPAFWVLILSVIACVVISVCFLTNPAKDPKEEPEQDKPAASSDENLTTEESGKTEEEAEAQKNSVKEWNYAKIFNEKGFQNRQLSDQYAMIDVPEEYLTGASKEQLIRYVVNYPYLVDAFVYDDPHRGVNHICDICSPLAELLKRDDAEELINKALDNLPMYISEDNVQGEYAESVAETFLRMLIDAKFEYLKDKVEIPSYADREIGADYPEVLYSDAEKLILHDSYGILVYDYFSRKLVGFADLRPMDMTRIQGDGATYAEVSEDGKYVKIYSLSETSPGELDPEKMYLYIVDQNSLSQVTSYDGTAEYFQPYQIQTKVYDWNGQLETTSESWLGSDGKMVSWKYEDDQGGMYYRNLVLVKKTEDGISAYRVFE